MTNDTAFDDLQDYIQNRMRMSHVYQPVMLRVLLEQGGTAALVDIAKALLSHDQSQVDYYAIRTKNMVGKVLTQNGIVERMKEGRKTTGYRLRTDALTGEQQATLIDLCDQKLNVFLEARGKRLWSHRSLSDGYLDV